MNIKTIEYITDFLDNPKIIDTKLLSDDMLRQIPDWWKECFKYPNGERVKFVVQKWRSMEAFLPITLTFLENNLTEVEFVSHSGSPISMIYKFEFENTEPSYYEGRVCASYETIQHNIPLGLKKFYTELHNGWTEVASDALGPMPVEKLYTVTDGGWELEDTDFDTDNLLVVFNNGGSGYLCADLQKPETSCVIWWNDDAPMPQTSFWGVMDAWIEIGFEDE